MGPCKVMGPNERVKTDHTDWNHQSMVLSKGACLVSPTQSLSYSKYIR